MNIGKNIKYLRQQNNVTQETLADYLGVSYQAVSKWETDTNTPDIALLPDIAKYFNISLDTLFSENISTVAEVFEQIQDDDIIRVIQLQGKRILKLDKCEPEKSMPIELIFPHNCNDKTQYFKVEVWGSIIADSSINGDIVCHQNIHCGTINGYNIECQGDIKSHEINVHGSVTCNNIIDCYKIQTKAINCSGNINCQHIDSDVEL